MRYYRIGDSVQSISNNHQPAGAIEITEKEYYAFIAALPKPEPQPEPVDELALLKERITKLESDRERIDATLTTLQTVRTK